ncbi:MAG: hypothetical protein ACFFA0_03990 [Promethearchaeota archaeon]
MKNVILYKSNDGLFKDCCIINLKDWMSKNNNFKKVNIKFLQSNKKDVTFSKGNILTDTKIIKSSYKIKKLFYINLKTELPVIIWTIGLFSFTFIGLGILLWLNALKYDIWYFYLIIPGNFVYFILIAMIGFYVNEYYFKVKLKRKEQIA